MLVIWSKEGTHKKLIDWKLFVKCTYKSVQDIYNHRSIKQEEENQQSATKKRQRLGILNEKGEDTVK